MLGSAPSYDHYVHLDVFTVVKAVVDLGVLILYAYWCIYTVLRGLLVALWVAYGRGTGKYVCICCYVVYTFITRVLIWIALIPIWSSVKCMPWVCVFGCVNTICP